MSSVETSIHDLFHRLEAAFNARSVPELRALWPDDLVAPFYLAEERVGFIRDWATLQSYWADLQGLEDLRAGWQVTDIAPLGPDTWIVGFDLWWMLKPPGASATAGEVRGIGICTARGDGHALVAYVEAPLAPIVYMRELYARAATARAKTLTT